MIAPCNKALTSAGSRCFPTEDRYNQRLTLSSKVNLDIQHHTVVLSKIVPVDGAAGLYEDRIVATGEPALNQRLRAVSLTTGAEPIIVKMRTNVSEAIVIAVTKSLRDHRLVSIQRNEVLSSQGVMPATLRLSVDWRGCTVFWDALVLRKSGNVVERARTCWDHAFIQCWRQERDEVTLN